MWFRADLLATEPLLDEAAGQDVDSLLARLKESDGWSASGKTRKWILGKVDNDFIRHRIHYDRMAKGGERDDGSRIRASRGILKVLMQATTNECVVTIDGSREWDKNPHTYKTRVSFANYGVIREASGMSWLDKARVLLEDNLKVDCDCPAFRYFYRYPATKRGFSIIPENVPARVRNPNRRGAVCKHLEHSLHYLGGSYSTIASAMRKHAQYMEGIPVSDVPALTESHALICGNLHEAVLDYGFLDVLTGIHQEASKRGMARTAQAISFAIAQAKVEGASVKAGQ